MFNLAEEIKRISTADLIDPVKNYYLFRYYGTTDGRLMIGAYTEWVGYENDDPTREIRKPCAVKAELIARHWGDTKQEFMVLNTLEAFAIFMGQGGNALIEESIARQMLSNRLRPRVYEHRHGSEWAIPILPEKAAYNRAPSPKLRMKVVERDNYRCRICGRRAQDNTDIELHAHHILPHGEGGLSEEINLMTLCSTCHRGLNPHFKPRLFQLLPKEQQPTDETIQRNSKLSKRLYRDVFLKDLNRI